MDRDFPLLGQRELASAPQFVRLARVLGRAWRSPGSARLALRLASLVALATGGVVFGRGVVGMANSRSHLTEVAGVSASALDASPVVAPVESAPAAEQSAPPDFSSNLRSWATNASQANAASDSPLPGSPLAALNGSLVQSVGAQSIAPSVSAQPVAPPVQLPAQAPVPAPVQVPAARPAPSSDASSASPAEAAASPDAAVRSFYADIDEGQFDQAAGLWTQRMRSAYPPAENITSRFARTQALTVRRADVTQLDAVNGRATVAVQLSEVVGTSPAVTRQYVGNWYLVRGPAGWLLDQPALQQQS